MNSDHYSSHMGMLHEFPSPEAKTASRLALPRKNRGGGGSATETGDFFCCSRVSDREENNRPKGGLGGDPTWPGGQGARPAPGRTLWSPGPGATPLRVSFWLRGSSDKLEFLEFFGIFLRNFIFHLFLHKNRHTGNSAENSVSPG